MDKQWNPQNSVQSDGEYPSGSTKSWSPCATVRVDWVQKQILVRHLQNYVMCTGMLRKPRVNAHSLLHEDINKGAKKCQLKLFGF